MKTKPVIAFTMGATLRKRLLTSDHMKMLKAFAGKLVFHNKDTKADMKDLARILKDADACVTSWGSPAFTPEVLALAPKLKVAAHAAGSIKHLVSDEFYRRGIVMVSAAGAMAPFVAETALGFMLMGIKDIFAIREKTRRKGWDSGARATSREIYNRSVGIIGASFVGRNVIRLLKNFPVKEILLYDPYLKAAQAKELGVKKVTLDALLKTCDIVSLHAPATPETKHMLGAKQFRMMRDRAVFINTARGQCVDEKALVAELKKGRITAFIDVTDPEPPKPTHPFFRLDNVILTPHLAGMVTDYSALSRCAIEEIGNFFAGRKVKFTVTKEMLPRIA